MAKGTLFQKGGFKGRRDEIGLVRLPCNWLSDVEPLSQCNFIELHSFPWLTPCSAWMLRLYICCFFIPSPLSVRSKLSSSVCIHSSRLYVSPRNQIRLKFMNLFEYLMYFLNAIIPPDDSKMRGWTSFCSSSGLLLLCTSLVCIGIQFLPFFMASVVLCLIENRNNNETRRLEDGLRQHRQC